MVSEEQEYFEMFFFKAKCAHCKIDVAIFDPERKMYFFTSVVPNLIGWINQLDQADPKLVQLAVAKDTPFEPQMNNR